MNNGTRDVLEQLRQNTSNYGSGNPFGGTTETRYHPDSGTPRQGGGLDRGQFDYFDDPKRGQYVRFPEEKLKGSQPVKKNTPAKDMQEEIEIMRDQIAELLDFKDRSSQSTNIKLMEQVESLQNEVQGLKRALLVAENLKGKIEKLGILSESIDTINTVITNADRTRSALYDVLWEYQKDFDTVRTIGLGLSRLDKEITDLQQKNTFARWRIDSLSTGIMLLENDGKKLGPIEDVKKKLDSMESIEKRLASLEGLEERICNLERSFKRVNRILDPRKENFRR